MATIPTVPRVVCALSGCSRGHARAAGSSFGSMKCISGKVTRKQLLETMARPSPQFERHVEAQRPPAPKAQQSQRISLRQLSSKRRVETEQEATGNSEKDNRFHELLQAIGEHEPHELCSAVGGGTGSIQNSLGCMGGEPLFEASTRPSLPEHRSDPKWLQLLNGEHPERKEFWQLSQHEMQGHAEEFTCSNEKESRYQYCLQAIVEQELDDSVCLSRRGAGIVKAIDQNSGCDMLLQEEAQPCLKRAQHAESHNPNAGVHKFVQQPGSESDFDTRYQDLLHAIGENVPHAVNSAAESEKTSKHSSEEKLLGTLSKRPLSARHIFDRNPLDTPKRRQSQHHDGFLMLEGSDLHGLVQLTNRESETDAQYENLLQAIGEHELHVSSSLAGGGWHQDLLQPIREHERDHLKKVVGSDRARISHGSNDGSRQQSLEALAKRCLTGGHYSKNFAQGARKGDCSQNLDRLQTVPGSKSCDDAQQASSEIQNDARYQDLLQAIGEREHHDPVSVRGSARYQETLPGIWDHEIRGSTPGGGCTQYSALLSAIGEQELHDLTSVAGSGLASVHNSSDVVGDEQLLEALAKRTLKGEHVAEFHRPPGLEAQHHSHRLPRVRTGEFALSEILQGCARNSGRDTQYRQLLHSIGENESDVDSSADVFQNGRIGSTDAYEHSERLLVPSLERHHANPHWPDGMWEQVSPTLDEPRRLNARNGQVAACGSDSDRRYQQLLQAIGEHETDSIPAAVGNSNGNSSSVDIDMDSVQLWLALAEPSSKGGRHAEAQRLNGWSNNVSRSAAQTYDEGEAHKHVQEARGRCKEDTQYQQLLCAIGEREADEQFRMKPWTNTSAHEADLQTTSVEESSGDFDVAHADFLKAIGEVEVHDDTRQRGWSAIPLSRSCYAEPELERFCMFAQGCKDVTANHWLEE